MGAEVAPARYRALRLVRRGVRRWSESRTRHCGVTNGVGWRALQLKSPNRGFAPASPARRRSTVQIDGSLSLERILSGKQWFVFPSPGIVAFQDRRGPSNIYWHRKSKEPSRLGSSMARKVTVQGCCRDPNSIRSPT